jgi:hypothetical protein
MTRLPKAIRESILRRDGALTEAEATAYVGAKSQAEFNRWRRSGAIGALIPGTRLWDPT